jgi:monovalent cation/proton antiporter MnhG/PhaG subunit
MAVSIHDVAIWVFVGLGVLFTLIACVGLVVMPDFYSRLHYQGIISAVSMTAILIAVMVEEWADPPMGKAIIIALVLIASSPVLTHATARAARIRQTDTWNQEQVGPSVESPEADLSAVQPSE